jgi:4,5-dihydroxyphthalate decarboxylase
MSSNNNEVLKLRTLLGDYPTTLALKRGEIASPRLVLDFADVKVPSTAFKQVIKGDFDAAELAIMTYLQAKGWGVPLVALPVVVHGRFQHGQLAYNADRGHLGPEDLPGRRIGVRTYPQTTPTWIRGILQNQFMVDPNRINWVTFEDGHVPEYQDPENTQRAPKGKNILTMLLEGELDAAILTEDQFKSNPGLKPLIPNPKEAAADWYRQNGAVQVNHIFTVKESLAKADPQAVKEIFRLFVASKKAAGEKHGVDGIDAVPVGYTANRRNFEVAAEYAWQQRLITRRLDLSELFDETTCALES